MNKYLAVVSFILSLLSFQVDAASVTKDLGTIMQNSSGASRDNIVGEFSDTYTFRVPENIGTSVSVTNAFVSAHGLITDFKATLNGVSLSLANSNSDSQELQKMFMDLAQGVEHTLVISGNAGTNASYAGSIQTAQTPIPPLAWLFGSALLGLSRIRRRS